MSIEQQLATLSEQMSVLAKAITLAVDRLSIAPTEKVAKGKKTTPADAAPVAPVAPVAPATTDAAPAVEYKAIEGYLLDGDPPGTRYFVVEAHNTAYKQLPGGADCTLAGAVIVPGKVYLAKKEEFEKKFKLAQDVANTPAQVTPEPATTEPTATASAEVVSMPVKFEAVIDLMRALHKEQGNDGVQKILSKYGVARIPMLNGVVPNETLIAEIEAVMLGF